MFEAQSLLLLVKLKVLFVPLNRQRLFFWNHQHPIIPSRTEKDKTKQHKKTILHRFGIRIHCMALYCTSIVHQFTSSFIIFNIH